MKKIFYIMITAALMLTACQKEQEERIFSNEAIGFVPDIVSNTTKATMLESDAQLQAAGFGVYAYYTGTNPFDTPASSYTLGTMMYNQQVSYSGGAWSYAPLQYWPMNNGKITFLAYAPYSATATVAPTTKMPQIPYTASTNLSDQNDLLWGVNTSGMPFTDYTKPADNTVHLHFHHALAKIHLTISSDEDFSTLNSQINGKSQYSKADTRILVESVTLTNLYSGATLTLRNTSADIPAWSDKTGDLTYTIDTDNNLPTSLQYVKDDDQSGWWHTTGYYNAINYKTLLDNWSSRTGVVTTATDLMNGKYIMAIPKEMAEGDSVQVTLKYHTLTRAYYYDYNEYDSYYTILTDNDNDGAGTTVTSTVKMNLNGGFEYNLNLSLGGNYMTLKVAAKDWTVETDQLNFSESSLEVKAGDEIVWAPATFDKLDGDKVYVNSHTAECTFKISSPKGCIWYASLIPTSGNATAFEFVDENGNPATARGVVGEKATIRIKSTIDTPTTRNVAILRIYVITSSGSIIAYDLGYNKTEYSIIQTVS